MVIHAYSYYACFDCSWSSLASLGINTLVNGYYACFDCSWSSLASLGINTLVNGYYACFDCSWPSSTSLGINTLVNSYEQTLQERALRAFVSHCSLFVTLHLPNITACNRISWAFFTPRVGRLEVLKRAVKMWECGSFQAM